MGRPQQQNDDRDRNFARNRDEGRGYRGRSQHRDYDPEHAGFDRFDARGRSRTGRVEDVPDGRWQNQPDGGYDEADRRNEGGYARSGRPDDDFLDEVPSRQRGRAPERTDYQSDDFDVHSYGRYQGRDHGGSGNGQRRGPDGGQTKGHDSTYPGSGRHAMDGRNYARGGHSGADPQPDPAYGSGDRNRGYTYPGGRNYDMDTGYSQEDASGMTQRGPHAGRGPKGYKRAPERILEDVCQLMTDHGHLDAREIEVDVEGDEVTLRGEVGDRGAKRLADDLAASVRGVHDVHNRLTIERDDAASPDEEPTADTEDTPA